MGLWGSPIQEGRAGFNAGYFFALSTRSRGIDAWRQRWDSAYATHGHPGDYPAAKSDPGIVPPAFYVELRALENRREEIESSAGPRFDASAVLREMLRPWPFRLLASRPEPPEAEPTPVPGQPKGQFLDVLA